MLYGVFNNSDGATEVGAFSCLKIRWPLHRRERSDIASKHPARMFKKNGHD